MSDESALLREYAATRSPEAFSRLARRYVDLVYAAARRQVRDMHLAEDVTQAVFIVLAQKARSVPADRPLSAWLLKTTSYCAANARRSRAHREQHERRAAAMARDHQKSCENEAAWEGLSPLLDEGMSKLKSSDRHAVLLRFFEKKSLREVGEALGITEEAAGKRVTRAVDRLRDFFRRRGATVSAAGLVAVLAAQSTQAAPAALAATVTTSAAPTAAAATLAKGAMLAMAMQKTTALVAAGLVLVLGIGGGAVVVRSMQSRGGPRTITISQAPTGATGSTATFSDGTTVQIVGIGDVPSSGGRSWANIFGGRSPTPPPTTWWTADGSEATAVSMQGLGDVSAGDALGRRQVRFIFSLRGPASKDGGLAIVVDGVNANASSSRQIDGESVHNYVGAVSEGQERARVRLAISRGPWREDASLPIATSNPATTQPVGAAVLGSISEEYGMCVVEMTRDHPPLPDRAGRVLAVLSDGRTVTPSSWQGMSGGHATMKFPCRKDQLARITWMSRPFEWVTIEDVALKPRAKVGAATAPTR